MKAPLFQVDAFSDRAFAGNPAAVCLLAGPAEPAWMQAVAAEMNLSETAFLVPGAEAWGLRWFTPAIEVQLCGHATLASAHVLWESGRLPATATARFHTASGLLTAARRGNEIELDFPAKPVEASPAPAGLAGALGAEPRYVGRSAFDYLVELASAEAVRELRPNFAALAGLPVRGVIVTAASDRPESDFISRFFAPGAGVNEDPVTGSAHCTLAPFWGARLGRAEMVGWQASARGGRVRVTLQSDRVLLGGRAVTVLRGELDA